MSADRIGRVPLRIARVVIAAVIAVDLVALVAMAVHTDSTTTRTVTPLEVAAATPSAPTTSAAPVPVSTFAPGSPVNALRPVVQSANVIASTPSTGSSSSPSSPPSVDVPEPAAPNCPLPLKPPAQTGGLQSLIGFAPAFGPFSAEAFAAASAYQPMLQLLGPLLAQYPAIGAHVQPELNAFLTPWQNILNAAFTLIEPAYAPHRQQILTAETKFAASLAPYSEKLAASPLGGCLVDLEAALVNDTRSTTSPTHKAG